MDKQSYESMVLQLLSRVDTLIKKAETVHIDGISKWRSLVCKERAYLLKIVSDLSAIQPSNVFCSNVPYLEAVFDIAVNIPLPHRTTAIFHPLASSSVRVDLVVNGNIWIKIHAGKLSDVRCDDESDSDRDVTSSPLVAQIQMLMNEAKLNAVHYQTPPIVVWFTGMYTQIPTTVTTAIQTAGAHTLFNGTANCAAFSELLQTLNVWTPLHGECLNAASVLNLDTSSLITITSSQMHCTNETQHLFGLFRNRNLVTTTTALEQFLKIVSTIGGPLEQARARYLFHVPPDTTVSSQHVADFLTVANNSHPETPFGRIVVVESSDPVNTHMWDTFSVNDAAVFGTGHALQATTMTAKMGIGRRVQKLGVSVILHESKSLISC